MKFYAEERLQERYHSKTPLEVRKEAFSTDIPIEYPIAINKRIMKYKKNGPHRKKLPHKFINHVVVQ